ncbi:MAG: hypothetical protein ACXVCV_08560 [Polyangia bacterium]
MRSFASSVLIAGVVACAGCFSPAPADHLYRCAISSQCPSGYGCAGDGYCYRSGHLPMMSDPCADGAQDGDESGVDCGGPTCPARCPLDGGCAGAGDCQSNVCNVITNVCVADDCHDGMRDDAESDVDCGGDACPKCSAGKACRTPGDCDNFLCNQTSQTCVADPCLDGVKDQSETDADCGGLCLAKCKNGQGCNTPADCVVGATCASNKCQVPHCIDGVKANGETDVDCGGADCSPCAVGKACAAGGDCASTFCNVTTHLCVANQCQDGVKDGGEADVDCGGPSQACPRCAVGKTCAGGSDCNSAGGAVCSGGGTCCQPSGVCGGGEQCGTGIDNCGQTINCGNNGACADAGKPYCKGGCCSPYNDGAGACAGKQCGSIPDGCGTTYACGTCAAGSTCSGAPSYQCCAGAGTACSGLPGCTMVSTACGTITCPCSSGQVCYGGSCCTPAVCGRSCVPYDDGCGGTCPATFHCAALCCDTVCGTTKYGCP